jgi:hypothetical protein
MSVSNPTILTNNGSAVDAALFTTASISPTANSLLVACIGVTKSGTPENPTASGLSLTWSAIDGGTDTNQRIKVFATLAGASPGSGAVTFDFGGTNQDGCVWGVLEIATGFEPLTVSQAIPHHNPGSGTGTGASVTLSSPPASTSLLIGTFIAAANSPGFYTEGTDWTELFEQGYSSTRNLRQQVQYWNNPTDGICDATLGSSVGWRGVVLEVVVPGTHHVKLVNGGLVGSRSPVNGGLVR